MPSAPFPRRRYTRILAEQADYDGEMQILLTQGDGRSRITLRLSDQAAPDIGQIREQILASYHDLREFVTERGLTEFVVERLPLAQFVATPVSGKLKHVVDLRQENPAAGL